MHAADEVFWSLESALDKCSVEDHLGHDIGEFPALPGLPQVDLVQSPGPLLLVMDVVPDYGLVPARRRYPLPARPEMLPHKVFSSTL